jgi:ArsR family transcriptional regulator
MNGKPKDHYEFRAAIAKALAHPSRLLILDTLQQEERCVCELTELVGADQSTVSKHLAILKSAGLVAHRKEASMSYYRLTCPCLDAFFGCMESVMKQNIKAQQMVLGG